MVPALLRGGHRIPKRGHTGEEILRARREVGAGAAGCRKLGLSAQPLYGWQQQYASLGLSERRARRQLREENAKLTRLVADLSLDRHILQEIVGKKL